MATDPTVTSGPPSLPFEDLRRHGLLWLVNKTCFHPRGYALGLDMNEQGEAVGWLLFGDGSEPIRYEGQTPEGVDIDDDGFQRAEAFLAFLRDGGGILLAPELTADAPTEVQSDD